jgi:site-specific recombinase XerD
VPTRSLKEAEAAYLAFHRARNHSPATIDHYAWTFTDLHRFLAETSRSEDLSILTVATFQAFHTWLVETPLRKVFHGGCTRSARGVAGRMKDLRAFVKWLADEDWLDKVPKVPIPKVPKMLFPILSDADLVTLFSCRHLTARGEQAIRNRAIVALLLDTAIRRAEVVALTPRSLHLEHDYVTVVGKGSKERIVPVSHGTKALLLEWLKIRGTDDGPLV